MNDRAQIATGPAVQFRPIEDLALYERNARTHSDEQVAQLIASIVEFGWTMPVLADSKGVVAGHARIAAASKHYAESSSALALPDGTPIPFGTVPVLHCEGWPDARRRAYIIADNKLALNAGWDVALLTEELTTLLASDLTLDLNVIGFNDAELGALMAPPDPPGGAAQQWGGMPEYKNEDKNAHRSIVVHFVDEAGVEAFSALIEQPITKLTKSVWYPRIEPVIVEDKAWK